MAAFAFAMVVLLVFFNHLLSHGPVFDMKQLFKPVPHKVYSIY